MQFVYRSFPLSSSRVSRTGFTLIELIVALAVMGVATTIFMKMYMTSMDLAKLSKDRQVAGSIAAAQLDLVAAEPQSFLWDLQNPDSSGLFRIRKESDEPRGGAKVELPKAMPPDQLAYERQVSFYDQFRCKTYGRLGDRGLVYEVIVDVQWDRPGTGAPEHITLTGAVARSKVEPGKTEGK